MPRAATVVSLSAQSPTNNQWQLHLRKNKDPTNLHTLTILSGGASDIAVDLDLDFGDVLEFYVETSAFLGIKHPLVWAEIAWRVV